VVEVVTDVDARNRELYRRCVLPEVEVLLRVARGMTGQSADAEDLVQDTLLRAWRSIGTFDGQHPRAWLLTILRNTHINRNRRQRPVLLDDPDQTFERHRGTAVDMPSAEDLVVDRTFDAAVESAVNDLPAVFRDVLVLVDVQGLSYAAVADVLGVPEGTVMSRLHRARKRVRASLAKHGLVPRRSS
jgi:RNA polymerase sigma-70 factor (ECF subfamily)